MTTGTRAAAATAIAGAIRVLTGSYPSVTVTNEAAVVELTKGQQRTLSLLVEDWAAGRGTGIGVEVRGLSGVLAPSVLRRSVPILAMTGIAGFVAGKMV